MKPEYYVEVCFPGRVDFPSLPNRGNRPVSPPVDWGQLSDGSGTWITYRYGTEQGARNFAKRAVDQSGKLWGRPCEADAYRVEWKPGDPEKLT